MPDAIKINVQRFWTDNIGMLSMPSIVIAAGNVSARSTFAMDEVPANGCAKSAVAASASKAIPAIN